ncbi:hypothetical protein C8R45DRAFT_1173688 [Mycena sanguinolenta]|nr:hypothetical protein C8R45DRAFT_1173688 [Mycena sanguinolenta]
MLTLVAREDNGARWVLCAGDSCGALAVVRTPRMLHGSAERLTPRRRTGTDTRKRCPPTFALAAVQHVLDPAHPPSPPHLLVLDVQRLAHSAFLPLHPAPAVLLEVCPLHLSSSASSRAMGSMPPKASSSPRSLSLQGEEETTAIGRRARQRSPDQEIVCQRARGRGRVETGGMVELEIHEAQAVRIAALVATALVALHNIRAGRAACRPTRHPDPTRSPALCSPHCPSPLHTLHTFPSLFPSPPVSASIARDRVLSPFRGTHFLPAPHPLFSSPLRLALTLPLPAAPYPPSPCPVIPSARSAPPYIRCAQFSFFG